MTPSDRFVGLLEPFATMVLAAVVFAPILSYWWTGTKLRRLEIVGAMSEEGVRRYFQKFFPSIIVPVHDPVAFFEKFYAKRYGRRQYVVPMVLLGAVLGTLLFLTTRTVFAWLDATPTLGRLLPSVAVAAVAGAYLWVAGDMVNRNRSRELSPSDISWSALRLIISIPLGYAFAAFLKDEVAFFVAFALGAFPTPQLMTIMRRIGSRKLGLSEAGDEPRSDLELLQGISPGVAERLRDQGVLTILQLAYCDPVDLTIRCHYAFSFVVDGVSQALAWPYWEKDFAVVQQFGLRGAYEVSTLMEDLDSDDDDAKAAAQRTIHVLAMKLDRDPVVFTRTLREVSDDPYTEFIVEVWETQGD